MANAPIAGDAPVLGGRDIVLELRVRNHPGTLSHVAGLFARRAFNLDAVVCVPEQDPAVSRMLLLVGDEPKCLQLERQVTKLHDVVSLRHRPDLDRAAFDALRRL